ncbi:transmembrane protein [Myxozyma melibiosi]|uniref:Magnesium-transporting ATPase, P-type 1 n=1 Tax=Myxozyma melibiosi TaxID=54550 RepID=A0ABR1F4U4_9ASCO
MPSSHLEVRLSQDEKRVPITEKAPLTAASSRSGSTYGSVQDDVLVDIGSPCIPSDVRSIRSARSLRKTGVWEDLKAWTNNVLFGKTANLTKSSEEEHRVASKLREVAALDRDEVLKRFDTGYNGLPSAEALSRLNKFGRNELESGALKPWYSIIFQGLIHPFNVLLMVLGILAIAVAEDPTTFYFVLVMVVVSVGLRSYEEMKSQKSFQSMRELVTPMTKVLRPDGAGSFIETEIALAETVPGDVVVLRPGDIFPGDCILIESKDLFISQSSLTGEFLPVEKSTNVNEPESVFDLANICFMSTSVVSGRGRAVVISTAKDTYISTINSTLNSEAMETRNSFDVGVRKVAYLLLGFGVVMVPIVIVINGLTTHDWYEAVLFGMSVLIGLTPEMLPMILNANLAYGAAEMAKHKTIVRKLDAIQTMGVVDVICSDKTGTLTKDDVVLTEHLDSSNAQNTEVLKYAFLNSHFSTGLKNVLDEAVIKAAEENEEVRTNYAPTEKGELFSLVEELPFDFVRRRMSVVLKTGPSTTEVICKGAVEELLEICSSMRQYTGSAFSDVTLSVAFREELLSIVSDLNNQGLRVLAVAVKNIPEKELEAGDRQFSSEKDEMDMTFIGFLTFLDPPKDDCAEAIEDFGKYHVGIKVLTGDNLAVACKICKDVGIDTTYTITGAELEEIEEDEDEFAEVVERCTVFAKLTPFQKFNIVNALKKNGHSVGFLGDGINDALALRGADVGISVDTATPLAKDAADFILLEKSLNVITQAIIRGRITHANTIKYIKMAASGNFGNVFSVIIASAWLPFQPMTGNQILTQNLLYDLSQIAIPWDHVDEEFLLTPHQWSADSIFKFMLYFGPLSSIFDVYTFAVLYWFFDYNTPFTDDVQHFQTCWFYVGLITQTLIVHMIRTEKIPFIQRNPSWQLAAATGVVIAVGIAIPYTPLGTRVLDMLPVPGLFYPFLILAIVGYFISTQVVKRYYMHRYKEWL